MKGDHTPVGKKLTQKLKQQQKLAQKLKQQQRAMRRRVAKDNAAAAAAATAEPAPPDTKPNLEPSSEGTFMEGYRAPVGKKLTKEEYACQKGWVNPSDVKKLKQQQRAMRRQVAKDNAAAAAVATAVAAGVESDRVEATSAAAAVARGMMDNYDKVHPDRRRAPAQRKKGTSAPVPTEASPPAEPKLPTYVEELGTHLPEVAQFIRGRWHYGRKIRDRRTTHSKVVWKDDSHYTTDEIESELFAKLRSEAETLAQADPDVAAVFSQLTSACEAKAHKAQVVHDLSPAAIPEEPDEARAVSIWFITNEDILTFERKKGGNSEVPRLDTFSGDMIADDENDPSKAALRILRNTVTLPVSWEAPMRRALAMDAEGQDRYRLITPHKPYKQVMLWYVRLSSQEAREQPLLINQEMDGSPAPPLQWRAHGDVISNLSNFPSLTHLGRSMGRWIVPLSAQH